LLPKAAQLNETSHNKYRQPEPAANDDDRLCARNRHSPRKCRPVSASQTVFLQELAMVTEMVRIPADTDSAVNNALRSRPRSA
jgi:hypothetical protein